ncbi:hypothetical protein [Aquipseudomonas campi]
MTIRKNDSRQGVLVAWVDINFTDFANGAIQAAIELPGGAIVTGGFIQPITSFNAATTATLKVGDAKDDDRYTTTPVDVKGLAVAKLDVTGYVVPEQGDLLVTLATSGAAATSGKCRLFVEYIRVHRTQSTQG